VKKRIYAPDVQRVLSGPEWSFALAVGGNTRGGFGASSVVHLDLTTFEPTF